VRGAFGAQALYILWSGNRAEEFVAFSDLLWYRLLPNPTFPIGLLPAILYISVPMFLIIAGKLLHRVGAHTTWRGYHPWRLLGIVAFLGVLFAGGMVVSVKIGGGSNLHNFDAYLALLAVITVYFLFDQPVPDHTIHPHKGSKGGHASFDNQPHKQLADRLPGLILNAGVILTVVATILFTLPGGEPYQLPTPAQIQDEMESLNKYVEKARQDASSSSSAIPPEMLFISNRHLLTFKYLTGITLVPEYERVFLMEMAMAGSPDYLGRFRQDWKTTASL
jgi:hypothetical protein